MQKEECVRSLGGTTSDAITRQKVCKLEPAEITNSQTTRYQCVRRNHLINPYDKKYNRLALLEEGNDHGAR